MGHVDDLESRVKEVDRSVVAVPGMVATVVKNMDESSNELKQVNARVTSNSASIEVLKNSVEILETRKDEQTASPPSWLSSSSGCSGSSIEEALSKQTRFNTAISLGHSPTMFFWRGTTQICAIRHCVPELFR